MHNDLQEELRHSSGDGFKFPLHTINKNIVRSGFLRGKAGGVRFGDMHNNITSSIINITQDCISLQMFHPCNLRCGHIIYYLFIFMKLNSF
jgi:hypothetical protein